MDALYRLSLTINGPQFDIITFMAYLASNSRSVYRLSTRATNETALLTTRFTLHTTCVQNQSILPTSFSTHLELVEMHRASVYKIIALLDYCVCIKFKYNQIKRNIALAKNIQALIFFSFIWNSFICIVTIIDYTYKFKGFSKQNRLQQICYT